MNGSKPSGVPIWDIRHDKTQKSLANLIHQALNPVDSQPRSMPTLLLYNERGLKLFEEITYLDEYYLTNAELEALQAHADSITAWLPPNARLVELGSGNLRKVKVLFDAFERAGKPVEYFALDLSLPELKRTFDQIDPAAYKHVSFHALHGTYDDGLSWLAKPENSKPTCLLFLGSSLGNFSRQDASAFLQDFKNVLTPSDLMLIGLDACQDPERVFSAYNDSQGVTEQFYRNGLDHANDALGYEAFRQADWGLKDEYDNVNNAHQASYIAQSDLIGLEYSFKKGEMLTLENAFKYSTEQSDALWHKAGLIPQMTFANAKDDYHLHLLSPATVEFPDKPSEYAASPVPSLSDWTQLWAAWDMVTKAMIPREALLNKPIQLRNTLIFYLGHIPTFADIHVTKATASSPTEPAFYISIFERGIDPDVDNPEVCHDHSEIPDDWPPLDEILDFQTRVRARVTGIIASGEAASNHRLGRAIWLSYEHEAMHLETFLYMLLQSENVLPPPGQKTPDFAALAKQAKHQRVPNQWECVPAKQIRIGLDDLETDLGPARYFAWDNERPSRNVSVGTFDAQSRPISNGEYALFLEKTKFDVLPASWICSGKEASITNGVNGFQPYRNGENRVDPLVMASPSFLEGKAIRTIYGPVPLKYAVDWPIMASYDELAAYAEWADGRIPTFEEARSIYDEVIQNKLAAQKVSSNLISAVNGHLCNEGVEETPPSKPLSHKLTSGGASPSLDPNILFVDLTGCDVAFKHWHPTPVTGNGDRLCGQGDTGGLWEWTSTSLATYDGFKAMDLYPGYTADFFDGKHNICLGGSWATVPRIAGRKSFVNWYQKNYPFVWATARLVRDVKQTPSTMP